jgi:alginate O-acetyltransferase complex protein AlgI
MLLFNSFAFLGFFAVVTVTYYLAPARWRWLLLLVASYYFYSTFDFRYLLLLGFTTLVAYGFGMLLARRPQRAYLLVGVAVELSVLFIFKYFDFFASALGDLLTSINGLSATLALPRLELLLPAGLSFYTFSCISYLVDVYRRTTPPERHLGKLAVYIAFFPKLLAGPIERAGTFLSQLAVPVRFDRTSAAIGLQLMVWGLFKKVVIADRLAAFVDAGFANAAFQSPINILIAVYFYAFQIYCDFSGYSDIAIGAALVLGFRLGENFRRSYLAQSVPEFWNSRWHITLMRWFRDYVYIPMGGSRVAVWRRYLNVMIVFLVSGLWHGANWTFVMWGGLNGLYQITHAALATPRRWLSEHVHLPKAVTTTLAVLLTFHLITLAWIFFRASTISSAFTIISRLWGAVPQLPMLINVYHPTSEFYLSIGLIVFLMVIEIFDELKPMSARLLGVARPLRWTFYYAVIFLVLVLGVWNTKGFVYMQF